MTRPHTATTSLRSLKSTGAVLTAYLFLTILMTWPTVLHLADGIPGDGFDGWQNYWNLWWVKEALLVLGTSPYFTDYLYPPIGTNLLFHTLNIFNGLWTLPLQLNFGLAIAYNSVVFFSFVLAGYGGYLLSLYTLSRLNFGRPATWRPAAFVGGLIFTMSPFHLAHLLGHMQVFSMIWPPFYILWLLRTLQPWGTPASYPRRDVALTCLFLILATSIDWYHTLYLLMFTGLVLVWAMWSQVKQGSRGAGERGSKGAREQRGRGAGVKFLPRTPAPPHPRTPAILRPLWPVLAIGLGFGLVFAPLLLPMIREAGNRPDLETGLSQNITLSADLLAFFLPSEMHPLWGDWAAGIANNFTTTTSERLIFAGFVPLALALFATIRLWRYSLIRFWAVVTVVFFGLALGPFLHINGHTIMLGNQPLPLPYLLLYHTIPFIDLTRSLSRYDLMVMLSLGVLAAIALVKVQLSITNPQGKRYQLSITTHHTFGNLALPLLTTTLICFEFLPIPYPISRLELPQFYRDIAAEPEQYTIAELPMNWDRPTPLLHQTVHHKRLLTAYTSRNNPLELAWRTPVLQQWRYLGPDIIDQPPAEIAPTIFFDFNLRYIVLDYWQMPPGPEREGTEQWVAAALPNATPVYDDGRLKVYQTPAKGETRPYLSLGQGWSDRQQENDQVSRSLAAPQTELFLHHPQNKPLTLEISATGGSEPNWVTLSANGKPVTTFEVGPAVSSHRVSLPALAGELVKLELSAADPTRPVVVLRLDLQPGDEE